MSIAGILTMTPAQQRRCRKAKRSVSGHRNTADQGSTVFPQPSAQASYIRYQTAVANFTFVERRRIEPPIRPKPPIIIIQVADSGTAANWL